MPDGNATPERKRISIPRSDESVLRWWAAQDDPTLSIRLLIRAELERSGYIDYASRPIGHVLQTRAPISIRRPWPIRGHLAVTKDPDNGHAVPETSP